MPPFAKYNNIEGSPSIVGSMKNSGITKQHQKIVLIIGSLNEMWTLILINVVRKNNVAKINLNAILSIKWFVPFSSLKLLFISPPIKVSIFRRIKIIAAVNK